MFWHTFRMASILTFFSGILCGWGRAGNTLIRSLRWRSGEEHSDPELAVEARWWTLWSGACKTLWSWACGVGVRRGTLWSWAYGGGPAGNTLILSLNTLIRRLQWRSGEEHSDPELAVEVRRGTLWSGACGGGPAGNTLILSLRWRCGGEHADLELALEVGWGTLWSGAFGGGPTGNTLILSLQLRSGEERRKEEAGKLT